VRIAVLGPGGVGGLLAAALQRSGEEVIVVAQASTVEVIERQGIEVRSITLGDFTARPAAVEALEQPVDALLVATKAAGLAGALDRIRSAPALVVPLLNGLDHMALLRDRLGAQTVAAGSIRVEADRPEPAVIVHTSPFLLVSMAAAQPALADGLRQLARALEAAGVSARVQDSEADVLWSKLVRLNALACTTSAYDKLLGEIRSTPELRADLVGAMEEGAAVGLAEGASDVSAEAALSELERAHATLGSSMQRDIAAGRVPELDAIPGSVLRAGARHGIACPTITRLAGMIAERAGVAPPVV
jgi:2-dehydropantoate 2-reductase